MAVRFVPMDHSAPELFPRTFAEYVPQGHPVRFVVHLVERADVRGFESSYSGRGSAAYPPTIMLAQLLHGYATGIFSSRKLEEASLDSLAFRGPVQQSQPGPFNDQLIPEAVQKGDQGLVRAGASDAREMGLTKLDTESLDGTMVRANATEHGALSWRRASELEKKRKAKTEQLFRLAEDADQQEVAPAINVPAELKRRKERLEGIERARAALEAHVAERLEQEQRMQQRKLQEKATSRKIPGKRPQPPKKEPPRDKDQLNLTDEESRIMPQDGGFAQCHNGQIAVCHDSRMIATQNVSQHSNDVQEVDQELEGQLDRFRPDAGDGRRLLSRSNVFECEADGVTPLISTSREKPNVPLLEKLAPTTREETEEDPQPCPGESMIALLKTGDGRQLCAAREATAETVSGIIKQAMAFCPFLTRAKEAVQSEWALVCTAFSIRRLHALKSGLIRGRTRPFAAKLGLMRSR